ncbi:hypothetical protein F0919_16870 [Taibaiella lutea]|uniref:DUF3575 domain-containing protein n=1 Tax=Taibaiella lutea TaxID=2608001 RepID=A0A5M6CDC9_9BACT|nr:hypothetical protein [Taibaiella lutea]KAA5532460.1 hypothetical protein F0919_16870 [Taibaiella lutea]
MHSKLRTFCAFVLILFTVNANGQLPESEAITESPAYGNNIISVAPFSANNKGLNIGFSYERFFNMDMDGRFSLYVPILYNSHAAEYHERDKYAEKNLGIYLGLKYYTAGSHAPVRYAMGVLFGNITSYRHTVEIYYPGPGGNIPQDRHSTYTLTGCMFHNSLNVFFAGKFSYSMELDLGLAAESGNNYGDETLPLALFQMSLGYRF